MRHLPGRVGAGRRRRAVLHEQELRGDPGAPELHEVRPAGPRVPAVAVAAGPVRAAAVRRRRVLGRRQGPLAGVRRGLAGQEPHAVPHVPPLQGGVSQRHLQDDKPGIQNSVLRALQLHHLHLLVAVSRQGEPVRPRRRAVGPLPRRAGRRLAGRRGRVRLRRRLGGELVHPAVHVLRGRPPCGLPLLPRPRRRRPHAALLAARGVPHRAAGGRRRFRGVQRDGDRADAVADVALRGREVGQGRRLPADEAVRGERDAHRRAGPRLPRGAGGGVRQGGGGGEEERERGEADADGHDGGDAAPAGRAPEPVRALGARERHAVQRLRALVPAWADRHVERDAVPDAAAGLIDASLSSSCCSLPLLPPD